MIFTARVTTIWTDHASIAWEQLRDAKISEMATAEKTDGSLVAGTVTLEGAVFQRDFIDRDAAQEYVEWWNTTEAASKATATISDI